MRHGSILRAGYQEADVDQTEFEEAIREGYAALNRGEEPSLELVDESFEGVNLPEQALGMPAMTGRDGLLAWIRAIRDVWDGFQLVPERITWLKSDAVVVQVLLQGRGKASGVPVSQRFYNLWTVRNGRAVRLEVHETPEEAINASRRA
jgi:ketosteroid isomerase-like protein